jgi:hypothetical protein
LCAAEFDRAAPRADDRVVAAERKGSPPESSPDDFEWPPRDVDKVFVRADALEGIASLRPGWRRAGDPLHHGLSDVVDVDPAAAAAAARPRARPERSAAPRQSRPSRSRRVVIAAASLAALIVIALPWVLVLRGSSPGRDAAPAATRVTDPVVAPATEAPRLPAISVPREFRPVARSSMRARSAAAAIHAVLQAQAVEAASAPVPALEFRSPPPATEPPAVRQAPRVVESPPTVASLREGAFPPAASPAAPSPSVPSPSPVAPSAASPAAAPPVAAPPVAAPLPAAPALATPAPVAGATDERLVNATLRQYAIAFEQLDAAKVAEVWPGADRRALSRAFNQIEYQQVSLDACKVRVSGATANADCDGWITFVPKVGKKDPRTVMRQWDFALQKGAGGWQITTASSR